MHCPSIRTQSRHIIVSSSNGLPAVGTGDAGMTGGWEHILSSAKVRL
jgi:hypothetical protein